MSNDEKNKIIKKDNIATTEKAKQIKDNKEKKESKIIQISLSTILIVTFIATFSAIGLSQMRKLPTRSSAIHKMILQQQNVLDNQELINKNQLEIEKKINELLGNTDKLIKALIFSDLNNEKVNSSNIIDYDSKKNEQRIEKIKEINFLLQIQIALDSYDVDQRKNLLSKLDDFKIGNKDKIKKILIDDDTSVGSIVEAINSILISKNYAEDSTKLFNTIKISKKKNQLSGIGDLKLKIVLAKSIDDLYEIICSATPFDENEQSILNEVKLKIQTTKEKKDFFNEQIALREKELNDLFHE